MDNITATVFLLVGLALCIIFYCGWRKEREANALLRMKASCVDSENFYRQLAEWKYDRLKEAIEAECQSAPKTLAALRMRVKWIENPPLESFRPQIPKKKRGRAGN